MAIGTILTALSLVKDLAPSIGGVAEKFLDGKVTGKQLAAEAAKQELSAEVQLALAQIQLNTTEASHKSMFVSGWRPMVGWICALAMGFNFLCVPILMSFGLTFEAIRSIYNDASTTWYVRNRWSSYIRKGQRCTT